MVREQRTLDIAMADRLGRLAMLEKGCRVGLSTRRCVSCQSDMILWCGWERNQDTVVLVQLHTISVVPLGANGSAGSFPGMFTCDRVHFALILQPASCRTFSSSRDALTYSLPTVGPLLSALRVFCLSRQSQMSLLFVPLDARSLRPSWIVWISPSSMSQLTPIWHHPSNRSLLSGPSRQCHALSIVPIVILEPSVYSRMSARLKPPRHSVCLFPSFQFLRPCWDVRAREWRHLGVRGDFHRGSVLNEVIHQRSDML